MLCPACEASVEFDQHTCGNCGKRLPRIGPPPDPIGAFWDFYSQLHWRVSRAIDGIIIVAAVATYRYWRVMLPIWALALLVAYVAYHRRRKRLGF